MKLVLVDFGMKEMDKEVYDEDGDFNVEYALATLLYNDVLILNSSWWEKDWPERAKEQTSIAVFCSDVFAYCCADAETISYRDIQSVYDHWVKHPIWGPIVFCIKKRKMKPVQSVYDKIQKLGIWDLDDEIKE